MALKFAVLVFFTTSVVFANPYIYASREGQQQFSEEQERPPWLHNQFVEQQQWMSQLDKSTIAQEIARAEQQARCHPVTVFFVSVAVCQQTATECGSVTVKTPWADVDVQLCKKGEEPSIVHDIFWLMIVPSPPQETEIALQTLLKDCVLTISIHFLRSLSTLVE